MKIIRTNGRGILFAVVSALALAGPAPALARVYHGDGIGGGAFFGSPATWHALDLTGEQKRTMRGILQTHGPEIDRLAADERAATAAIRNKLYGTDPVTPEDLDELARRELETRSALTHERLTTALEVRNALTPEQIQRIASMRTGIAQMEQEAGANRPPASKDGSRVISSGAVNAPFELRAIPRTVP
jgi:Spy/CpxP family protein refolding chaperone